MIISFSARLYIPCIGKMEPPRCKSFNTYIRISSALSEIIKKLFSALTPCRIISIVFPIRKMESHEYIGTFQSWNMRKPKITIHESTIICNCPNGRWVHLWSMFENTSVPPLEARDFMIIPTPTPMTTPPKIHANNTSSPSLKGSRVTIGSVGIGSPINVNKSVGKLSEKTATRMKQINVFTPKPAPKTRRPNKLNGKLKHKAAIPIGNPHLCWRTIVIP